MSWKLKGCADPSCRVREAKLLQAMEALRQQLIESLANQADLLKAYHDNLHQ